MLFFSFSLYSLLEACKVVYLLQSIRYLDNCRVFLFFFFNFLTSDYFFFSFRWK
jgi:hypothetical protein